MALTKVKGHILADDLALGGNPTTSTQSTGNNTTRIATTAFVQTELAALVDSSPDSLNTLNELAAALGDDANFSTTVTNSIATKAPLATPQFTNRVGIGVAAHATAGLNITNTSQHIRLNNGSELGVISLESDGALRIWSHGDSSNNEIEFYQGTGSGSASMVIDGIGRVMIGTTSNSGVSNNADNLIVGDNTSSAEQGITLCSTLASGIRWNDGADAGLIEYIHSSNTMTFYTSAAERMRIASDGKVGIGTSSPLTPLHVVGANGLLVDTEGNGDGSVYFGGISGQDRSYIARSTNDFLMWNVSNGPTRFGTNNTERMRIDNSGNVGIGTTSISADDWGSASKILQISGTQPLLSLEDTDTGQWQIANSGQSLYMYDSVANRYGMTVTSDGNVGIEAASPNYRLHVHKAATGSNYIQVTNDDTGAASSDGLLLGVNSIEEGTIWNQENTSFNFGTNNQENFRLRTDGGIQFPDNHTFIATSNTAGGTAYEWGAIRRPATADGGQLSIRQYSSGETAAGYPAYAGGRSGWDENTGMFFYDTDEVGLTAGGNPTVWVEAGKKWELYSNGFTNTGDNRGHRVCLGGIAHNPSHNPGGSGSGTYLHIKTNVPKSNVMFRFEYKGFSYNDRNMDCSITGYTYTGTSSPYTPAIQDTGETTYTFKTPYYSSDNKLVLVLQVAANYTGGVLWAQFVGSHTMAPGSVAIVSTINSSSTSGAF